MNNFFDTEAPVLMQKLMDDFKVGVGTAAAVFGNAGLESNGFRSLQEKQPLVVGSRGGYGIMQWTGPRRRLYEAYCERNHLDGSQMGTNYAFLFVELKGAEGMNGALLQQMEKLTSLEAKTNYFMLHFLRPGIPHLDQRIKWAYRAQVAYTHKA